MKRTVVAIWIMLTLGVLVAPAVAQQMSDAPRDYQSMSQRDREREMQAAQWRGPSGFWTSPHKAEHGAYRYRLLGIGVALMLTTGLLTWRLVQRAKAPVNRTVIAPRHNGVRPGGPSFPTAVASFRPDGSSEP